MEIDNKMLLIIFKTVQILTKIGQNGSNSAGMKIIYQSPDENVIGKSELTKIGDNNSKWTENVAQQPNLSKFWLELVEMDKSSPILITKSFK